MINLVVNQSIICAEHVELFFYKVGYPLLQTGELQSVEILLQRGASLITKHHSYALLQRGKRYYKVEQLILYKVGQSLLHREACIRKKSALLQSGTGITNYSAS